MCHSVQYFTVTGNAVTTGGGGGGGGGGNHTITHETSTSLPTAGIVLIVL